MTKQEFKGALMQLVKNDYGFEIYNASDNLFRFSFYHLNSVYNSFCSSVCMNETWDTPSCNWQYATQNKRIEKLAKKVVEFAVNQYMRTGNYDYVEKEIEYYKNLSDMVFKAKYAMEIALHTEE